MNLRLPVDVYSADQLGAVILELRDYTANQHDRAAQAKSARGPGDAAHMSAQLLGVLHSAGVSADDRPNTEALIKELETLRTKAPIVHLTLPALPGRTLKRQLTVWFRAEINPVTLLTFTMRSDIGGGIIVQAGSRLYDFSFRQVLLDNKARIGEIFASVR